MTNVREFLGPEPLTGTAGERGVHWLRREDGGCLWLILDQQGTAINTLDEAVLAELDRLLADAQGAGHTALVLRSAKPSGFAAGADLAQFAGLADSQELRARVDQANAVVDRLAALTIPTICVVHGVCLGGGLEIALACDRIVARDDATLGFPEVLVGLHPGLGGTARLTRRIQPIEAMKLMLTGRTLPAPKARSLGLVDAVVPERNVANAVAAAAAGELPAQGSGRAGDALNLLPARKAIARQLRAETEKRAPREHYPAPHALIDLWERHGGSTDDMLAAERESFARLLPLPGTQNLIRAFFLRERLKANGKGASGIARVHVVGAGIMGADIGAWCALKGMTVTIEDPAPTSLSKAVAAANRLFARKLHGPARMHAADRFVPDPHGDGLRRADLVIEAGPERAEIKRAIYERVLARAKPDAILATNTSSLDLDALAQGMARPDRFVGIHFFNPVARLDLVEVVRHAGLAPAAYATALRFVADIGKLPLPVGNAPGFLVNRALTPYLGEALLMIEEGEQPERIDAAAEEFGMPMGPVALADQVGLDICLAVADSLASGLDQPFPAIPAFLREKVASGELGRKTGKGLYEYDTHGEPRYDKVRQPPDEALRDRLILPMLNAVAGAIDDGVVADADSADAAMIFGAGFAPFRGGPMHYAASRGHAEVADALDRLAGSQGERFRPSKWWRNGGA